MTYRTFSITRDCALILGAVLSTAALIYEWHAFVHENDARALDEATSTSLARWHQECRARLGVIDGDTCWIGSQKRREK